MAKTVVGLFDEYAAAHHAADELERVGFARNEISLVANETVRARHKRGDDVPGGHDRTAEGAGVGAALGGVAGLLIGLVAFAVPGVGPVLAVGPIATTLAGFGLGAAAGGLIGALTRAGVTEDEAHYYAEGVRRGGTLLIFHAEDREVTRAMDVMNVCGAIDVQDRAAQWHAEGFPERPAAFGASSDGSSLTPASAASVGTPRMYPPTVQAHPGDPAIPAVDNRPQAERPDADTGAVPAATAATGATSARPAWRERRARPRASVAERVRASASMREPPWIAPPNVPRANAGAPVASAGSAWDSPAVAGPTPQPPYHAGDFETQRAAPPFEAVEDDFRADCARRFADRGITYDQLRDAYACGYRAGADALNAERDFGAVEPELRTGWELERPGTWQHVRDAVRHAWDRARERA
jgi:hypothetical protein